MGSLSTRALGAQRPGTSAKLALFTPANYHVPRDKQPLGHGGGGGGGGGSASVLPLPAFPALPALPALFTHNLVFRAIAAVLLVLLAVSLELLLLSSVQPRAATSSLNALLPAQPAAPPSPPTIPASASASASPAQIAPILRGTGSAAAQTPAPATTTLTSLASATTLTNPMPSTTLTSLASATTLTNPVPSTTLTSHTSLSSPTPTSLTFRRRVIPLVAPTFDPPPMHVIWVESKCSDECHKRGSCNEEIGVCRCVAGYGGVNCSQVVMPGCTKIPGSEGAGEGKQTDGGGNGVVVVATSPCFLHSSCECVLDCDRHHLPHPATCVDLSSAPLPRQPSADNAADGATGTKAAEGGRGGVVAWDWYRVTTNGAGEERGRERVSEGQLEGGEQLRPPGECPERCSGVGTCYSSGCRCPWFRSGPACEQVAPGVGCVNACSGRGECVEGTCRCQHWTFGVDCSLFLDTMGGLRNLLFPPFRWADHVPPPSLSLIAPARPLVYVYDLPAHLNAWQLRHSLRIDQPEAVLFLERLLNSVHRTATPDTADFFYVPLFLRNRDALKLNLLASTITYIRATWPYWDRTNGSDHLFLLSDPLARCTLGTFGRGEPLIARSIVLSPCGYTRALVPMSSGSTGGKGKRKGRLSLPCFQRGQDIVIPPVLRLAVYHAMPVLAQLQDSVSSSSSGSSSSPGTAPETPAPAARPTVLFARFASSDRQQQRAGLGIPVRQRFLSLFESRAGELNWQIELKDTDEVGVADMLGATFCLATAGWGWDASSVVSVLAGCIPVVVQPHTILPLQHPDGLNWTAFSLRVPLSKLPDLPAIISSLSPQAIAGMQQGLRDAWPGLVWTSAQFNPLPPALGASPALQRAGLMLAEGDVFGSVMRVLRGRMEGKGGGGEVGEEEGEEEGAGEGGEEGGEVTEGFEEEGDADAADSASAVPNAGGDVAAPSEASTDGSVDALKFTPEGAVEITHNTETEEERKARTRAAQAYNGPGPDVSRPSKCAEGCIPPHGTCNEELGRCDCPPGFSGPTCQDLAMPECHLGDSNSTGITYSTPCSVISTCACAAACARWRLLGTFECFEGNRPDGTPETNLSALFSGPRYVVVLDDKFRDAGAGGEKGGGAQRVVSNEGPSPWAAPEECDDMCSGRGVCRQESKVCDCAWYDHGRACEMRGDVPFECFNDCSGRGTCTRGVCVCQRGFFGLDCSMFIDAQGTTSSWTPPSSSSPPLRPLVYVYDLPPYFNTWQFAHTRFIDWREPVFFLERLLRSPHRTADPAQADFFYVPLMLRGRGMKGDTLAWAISYIRATWPFWDRKNGSDHVFLTNDDWGNCEISIHGELEPLLANSVTVTLWGLTQNMHLEDKPNGCFRPGQDVVIPPMMAPDVYQYVVGVKEMVRREIQRRRREKRRKGGEKDAGVEEDATKSHGSSQLGDKQAEKDEDKAEEKDGLEAILSGVNRTTLLYFKGWPADRAAPHGAYFWSFGVRQEAFKLYRGRFNETGVKMESTEGVPEGYLVEMGRAAFCLAPSGWGWAMRTTQALMLGCIPVIIQPHVVQPFEGDGTDWTRLAPHVVQPFEGDGTDWTRLAVILSKADIPNLPRILRAIPESERRKKRLAMREEWLKFVWASTQLNPFGFLPRPLQDEMAVRLEKGDVFATVMGALRRRLEGKGGGRGGGEGGGKDWASASDAGAGVKATRGIEQAGLGMGTNDVRTGAAAGGGDGGGEGVLGGGAMGSTAATEAAAAAGALEEQQQRSMSSAAVSVSIGACNESCYTHGTCNEELKRCDCPPGFTGEDCSDLATPSCHVAPGYLTPCGLPSSCACALECERAGLPSSPVCLDDSEGGAEGGGGEGAGSGASPEAKGQGEAEEADDPALSLPAWQRDGWQGLSSLLEKPLVRMATDGMGGETGARVRVTLYQQQQQSSISSGGPPLGRRSHSFLHPSQCPSNCSGLGVCLNSKQCMCPPMLSPPSCARLPALLPFTCLNGCHARGMCVHGFCICNPGHFGIDCSLSKAGSRDRTRIMSAPPFSWPQGLSLPIPAPVRSPLFFVYDLPPQATSWSLLLGTLPSSPSPSSRPNGVGGGGVGGGEWEGGPEGVEAVLFLERLLRSPYRTADPYAAQLYLIPVLPWAGPATILRAVHYVSHHWPFWFQSDGSNHLLLTTITPTAPAHSPVCSLTPDKSRHPLLARCSFLAIPVADTTFRGSPLLQGSPEPTTTTAAAATTAATATTGTSMSSSSSSSSTSGNQSSLPCFLPGQDLLLPPALPPIALSRSPFVAPPTAQHPPRGHLLLFSDWGVGGGRGASGGMGGSGGSDGGGEGSSGGRSGGVQEVRDRVMAGLREEGNAERVVVLSQDRSNSSSSGSSSGSSGSDSGSGSGSGSGSRFDLEAVVGAALESVFCLVLPGWTHKMEPSLFVLHGCIPVVLEQDGEEGTSLRSSSLVEWSEVSVTLPASQAHILVKSLLAIPQGDIVRRRSDMGKMWSKLVWASPSFNPLAQVHVDEQRRFAPWLAAGDTFQAIVAKLQKRLEQ
ncbi:hypothetical protein CLOP_g9376 [Closterium sp. NIES-67]|nr:hypothetical protein CLOP_g9376 [Closterium sp. NIES-67]